MGSGSCHFPVKNDYIYIKMNTGRAIFDILHYPSSSFCVWKGLGFVPQNGAYFIKL